jgi:hypothetical protein
VDSNTQKYIALFPVASPDASATKDKTQLTLPPLLSSSKSETLDPTAKKRLDMLEATRKLMASGELSKTPDEGMGEGREKVDLAGEGGKAGDAGGKTEEKKVEDEDDEFFDVDE